MNMVTSLPWSPRDNGFSSTPGSRGRLRVAAAIIDAVCMSALLWLAILLIVR